MAVKTECVCVCVDIQLTATTVHKTRAPLYTAAAPDVTQPQVSPTGEVVRTCHKPGVAGRCEMYSADSSTWHRPPRRCRSRHSCRRHRQYCQCSVLAFSRLRNSTAETRLVVTALQRQTFTARSVAAFNGTFITNRLYRAIGVFLASHLASTDNLTRTTKRQNTQQLKLYEKRGTEAKVLWPDALPDDDQQESLAGPHLFLNR